MKRILFKFLRYGFFAIVCLVTLLALLVAEENFRGKREWESYRREHEARGDRLDFKPLVPPPVPDDQNFAMTPLLRPLFSNENQYAGELRNKLALPAAKPDAQLPSLGDRTLGKQMNPDDWRAYFGGEDVLAALQKLAPELSEISGAVRRPYARFPIAYEKGYLAALPHIEPLMRLGKIYTLRACVELHEGRTDAALADVQTVFRLAESMKNEPLVISELVRISIWTNGLQAVWEGLADRRWSDAQLSALQNDLIRVDFPAGMLMGLHGDRAGLNETMLLTMGSPEILMLLSPRGGKINDKAMRFIPNCLFYQNMLTINRFYDETVFSHVDPASLRTLSARFDAAAVKLKTEVLLRHFGIPVPNLYTVLAACALPAAGGVINRSFYAQVLTDEAVVACALERYRLANGQYPDALEKLTPAFLQKIPFDAMSGKPLHYRLKDDGTFLLYSVGSNGKDDGGEVVLQKNGRVDLKQGDWVW